MLPIRKQYAPVARRGGTVIIQQDQPEVRTRTELYEDSIEVNASAERCYERWHDFANLPSIFHNVRMVRPMGENIWRWEMFDALHDTNLWDLLLVEDIPNRLIVWRTVLGPGLDMKAEIAFQPLGPDKIGADKTPPVQAHADRTRIVVTLCTTVTDDAMGKVASELFGIRPSTIGLNLSAFKATLESLPMPEPQEVRLNT